MTYKPVSAHDKLRDEILADQDARAMYEASKLQIELSLALKNARKKRHMTQEEVAELMHTHKPVVSRLESGSSDVQHFPSLLTIAKFASAVGYRLKLGLTPIKAPAKLKSRTHAK
jgi:transcriptional regulator with XRE-family HTH domain